MENTTRNQDGHRIVGPRAPLTRSEQAIERSWRKKSVAIGASASRPHWPDIPHVKTPVRGDWLPFPLELSSTLVCGAAATLLLQAPSAVKRKGRWRLGWTGKLRVSEQGAYVSDRQFLYRKVSATQESWHLSRPCQRLRWKPGSPKL
jgi:hypothetical protein